MSAHYKEPTVTNTLETLAPKFKKAVEDAIEECNDAGLDAIVFETYRSKVLQELYYARGRTVIPPKNKVTNASSNIYSWHGFYLACDVISKSKEWKRPESWFKQVADIFKSHGCKWGGDWKSKDLPHMQWGKCKPSPSDLARTLLASQGIRAVWKAVGAD